MNLEKLTRDQLVEVLNVVLEQRDEHDSDKRKELAARDRLLYNLQVHQVELEMQNRELREAQHLLEAAKQRYADLYDYAPVAYYTFDRTGIVKEVNLTGASMIGRSRDQILQMPFIGLVRFENSEIFFAHLQGCLQRRGAVTQELMFRTPRGNMWVEAVTLPVTDARAEVTSFRTTFTDIRRQKAEALEKARALASEQQLRARFEALDETNVVIGRLLAKEGGASMNELLVFIAERARTLMGASEAKVTLAENFASEPVAPSAQPHDTSADARRIDVPLRDRGGLLGTLTLFFDARDEDLSPDDRRTLEMLADRAATAIEAVRVSRVERRERARLTVLEQATQELAGVLDPNTVWEAVSRAARFTLPALADAALLYIHSHGHLLPVSVAHHVQSEEQGWTRLHEGLEIPIDHPTSLIAKGARGAKAVLAQSPFDLLGKEPPTASPPQVSALSSVIVVPLIARQRVLGCLCLGAVGDARPYGQADLAWADELGLTCAIAIDNASLFDELRSALRSRDTLLALVLHDLRGPLNAISLSASILEPPADLHDRRQSGKQVALIKRSAHWMSHLINDLLLAGQLREGRFLVHCQPEDVRELLEDALDFASPLASRKGVKLECVLPPAPLAVEADRERVRQVLSNLLANAIKFTPANATITLTANARDREVLFSVKDSGPGIPVHLRSRIFECYWTIDQTNVPGAKPRQQGLGLGLFIAKGIVEQHGGRIWVDSKPGSGACFCFTLRSHVSPSPAAPQG